ncbi:hypothetical protein DITRI_Ditri07aG0154400 [Diplodiscus trichospermus]
MASACNRFISRSLPSLKSSFRSNGPKSPFSRSSAAPSSTRSSLPSQSTSPLRRFSFSRCFCFHFLNYISVTIPFLNRN